MPLRIRLALLNTIIIAGAICLFGASTYALESRSLSADIDASIRAQASNLQTVYEVRASLSPRARERVIPQPSVFSAPAFHVQVIDPDGNILERSGGLGERRLPVTPDTLRRAGEEEDVFETVTLDNQAVRLFTVPLVADEEFLGYLQVARSFESVDDALDFLRVTLIGGGAILIVISMVVAWVLAGISLRPIGNVTRAARDVGLSVRLDRRLPPVKTRDEIARLADTFNRMMDRLESAFIAQRRFVADASHELRTPLTTIRGNLELLRRSQAVREPEMRGALEDVTAETERMSRLVNGLLALARADAGQELVRVPTRLDELVRVVEREAEKLAGDVRVDADTIQPVEVMAEPDSLKQLLLILVDNGVKYTSSGGRVTLSLAYRGREAVLTVRDTGCGIAEDELPHIFERFYRSPSARAAGGTGLGLSIAKWIADKHGARIEVDSRPGAGSVFTVTLPGSRPAAADGARAPIPTELVHAP